MMKVRSPTWIVIVGAVLAHATGGLELAAKAITSIDQSARAFVDLRAVVPQIGAIIHPAPVVAPKKKFVRKAK